MGRGDTLQDRHRRRIERALVRRAGLLSATKCRKLFASMESLGITHGQVKMLGDDKTYDAILREFADTRYTDDGCAEPRPFRENEELIIPIPDDLDPKEVCAGINELGKLDWQLDGQVLTIHAYSQPWNE